MRMGASDEPQVIRATANAADRYQQLLPQSEESIISTITTQIDGIIQ